MNQVFIAVCQLVIALGIGGFWIYFFLVENKNPEKSAVYLGFERSFPVPDLGWLIPTLILASIGLFSDLPFGLFFTITSGSALIFLGLLDISFNAQNGGYTTNLSDTLMNIFINAVCIIFGPIFLVFAWKQL